MAGRDVVMLEMESWPLERALGREVGRICAAIHRAHGIDLRRGDVGALAANRFKDVAAARQLIARGCPSSHAGWPTRAPTCARWPKRPLHTRAPILLEPVWTNHHG